MQRDCMIAEESRLPPTALLFRDSLLIKPDDSAPSEIPQHHIGGRCSVVFGFSAASNPSVAHIAISETSD
jgi:hypothetical protein